MKIHLVIANKNSGAEQKFLVKSHTRAGILIEDATAPAASGDTNSDDEEKTP